MAKDMYAITTDILSCNLRSSHIRADGYNSPNSVPIAQSLRLYLSRYIRISFSLFLSVLIGDGRVGISEVRFPSDSDLFLSLTTDLEVLTFADIRSATAVS
ncbi:hypothetical protein L1049_016335 [Liquidambar formosana]|uniref:Uncharacterized protein n=1 Tax=Liquidambar formosana TaxID=63359 RepID=A0AAP0RZM8_LIQFO